MESHFRHSSFREKTLEHVFIGDCLRRLWAMGIRDAEVLKAEVDAAGYDMVIEVRGVLRHIQLKASFNGSTVRQQTINGKLADKPSGCVVWIGFDKDTIELGPFYWFGGRPGEPLPSISGFKKAKKTTADSSGRKGERPNSYILKRNACKELDSIDEVIEHLFGPIE